MQRSASRTEDDAICIHLGCWNNVTEGENRGQPSLLVKQHQTAVSEPEPESRRGVKTIFTYMASFTVLQAEIHITKEVAVNHLCWWNNVTEQFQTVVSETGPDLETQRGVATIFIHMSSFAILHGETNITSITTEVVVIRLCRCYEPYLESSLNRRNWRQADVKATFTYTASFTVVHADVFTYMASFAVLHAEINITKEVVIIYLHHEGRRDHLPLLLSRGSFRRLSQRRGWRGSKDCPGWSETTVLVFPEYLGNLQQKRRKRVSGNVACLLWP